MSTNFSCIVLYSVLKIRQEPSPITSMFQGFQVLSRIKIVSKLWRFSGLSKLKRKQLCIPQRWQELNHLLCWASWPLGRPCRVQKTSPCHRARVQLTLLSEPGPKRFFFANTPRRQRRMFNAHYSVSNCRKTYLFCCHFFHLTQIRHHQILQSISNPLLGLIDLNLIDLSIQKCKGHWAWPLLLNSERKRM